MMRGAIYGFIVGDALGVPYEFKKRGTFECTGMAEYGTWKQPKGTWSDDTSMMLATMDSLKKCGKIDVVDMRTRFSSWLYENKYTANGDVFDVGNTTAEALRLKRGICDVNANGNGSLMRILPLAFTECSEQQVARVSAITHAHEISKIGCRIYVMIAKRLLAGENIGAILTNTAALHDGPYKRIKDIQKLNESDIRSSGYVVDTLEAALWCIVTSGGYKETVLKAVNLGGDTDTIAAIAGGLAGIIYGYDSIPEKWIDEIRNKSLINNILESAV